MMGRSGACGRADLAWALGRGGAELANSLAAQLGYAVEVAAQREPDGSNNAIVVELDARTPDPMLRSCKELSSAPFWRFERFEVLTAIADQPPPPPKRPVSWWQYPQDEAPSYLPLASWRELQPRLRRVFASTISGTALDVDLVVDAFGQARCLDPLPKQRHRRWGPAIQIIVDRSEHLVPIWHDQAYLAQALARLFPGHMLQQAVFHEGLPEPQLIEERSADGAYQPPPPGGIVMAMSDLGSLCARQSGVDPWLALGRRLIGAGCRNIALTPAPLDRVPLSLQRAWQVTPWEGRASSAPSDPMMLRERAERLLRLVSPAARIDPGLLRAVRLIVLGPDHADASTEIDAWQHPAVISTSCHGATLDLDASRRLRAAFSQEPLNCQEQVLALLRRWRHGLPFEVWADEILNLTPTSRVALPYPEEAELARQFFGHIIDGMTLDGVLTDSSALRSWIGRVDQRATSQLRQDQAIGYAFTLLAWRLFGENPRYRPHAETMPTQLPPRLGAVQRFCRIEQRGPFLALKAVESPADLPGSLLGAIRTTNGLLQVAELAPDRPHDFWSAGTPPLWAREWGRDEYGAWVTFAVPGQDGGAVAQRMRWIEPGRFLMGSPDDEPERFDDEGPQHEVVLSQGLWLSDTACTQAMWQAVMGKNPSHFRGPDRPVESLTWHDAQKFLRRLNELVPGLELVLPSEAQWEYACRAGTETATYAGPIEILGENNAPVLDAIAWYGGNSGVGFELDSGYDSSGWPNKQYPDSPSGTHPVKQKQPNSWGLHDMLGNVWEWCADHWHSNYEGAPADGSAWLEASGGGDRVLRGGSWLADARYCRSADRRRLDPGDRDDHFGFRPARVQAGAEPAGPGRGRAAERRPDPDRPSGAALLRLEGQAAVAACPAPRGPAFVIRSDCEALTFRQITKPEWASAMGRDRFGLWAEFEIAAAVAPPATGRGRGGRRRKAAQNLPSALVEPVVQRLRWIGPGRFMMGSPADEPGRWKHEGPQHEVVIGQGYWLFDTPCTQALWTAVMGENPSEFKHPDRPVETVSWEDAQKFLKQISQLKVGLDLVLPSEAQWEYACRAGTETATYAGPIEILGENNAPALDAIAWYGGNSGVGFDLDNGEDSSGWPEKQYPDSPSGTHLVKQKRPNAWGLHDMLGNVWEWCADHWHDSYEGAPADGTAWLEASGGEYRVLRGGSWFDDARSCRSAFRDRSDPGYRDDFLGFRPARVQS